MSLNATSDYSLNGICLERVAHVQKSAPHHTHSTVFVNTDWKPVPLLWRWSCVKPTEPTHLKPNHLRRKRDSFLERGLFWNSGCHICAEEVAAVESSSGQCAEWLISHTFYSWQMHMLAPAYFNPKWLFKCINDVSDEYNLAIQTKITSQSIGYCMSWTYRNGLRHIWRKWICCFDDQKKIRHRSHLGKIRHLVLNTTVSKSHFLEPNIIWIVFLLN